MKFLIIFLFITNIFSKEFSSSISYRDRQAQIFFNYGVNLSEIKFNSKGKIIKLYYNNKPFGEISMFIIPKNVRIIKIEKDLNYIKIKF